MNCYDLKTYLKSIYDMDKPRCLSVKKREGEWSNEVLKIVEHPVSFFPKKYGDRFIPRRYGFKKINSNLNIEKDDSETERDVTEIKNENGYWRRSNFELVFRSVFPEMNLPIMKLSDPFVCSETLTGLKLLPPQKNYQRANRDFDHLDWACYPRTRPAAFSDSTHDLPGFKNHSYWNKISWSAKGQIAASFGHDFVLWYPSTEATVLYQMKNVESLAFSPDGNVLAVGSQGNSDQPTVELWSVTRNYLHRKKYCILPHKKDFVRCIEWTQNGKYIACGSVQGGLYILHADTLTKFEYCWRHDNAIFTIKFSKNSKFFATSDVCGRVLIWRWKSLLVRARLYSQLKGPTLIAWHPWRDHELFIGEMKPVGIMIFNAQRAEIVAYYQRNDKICCLDAMVFSPISAELVISLIIKDSNGSKTSEILVLASLDRVVDVLSLSHDGRTHLMIWSPDGLQLATASDDELLTIWNFFAVNDKKLLKFKTMQLKHKEKPKKSSQIELYQQIR